MKVAVAKYPIEAPRDVDAFAVKQTALLEEATAAGAQVAVLPEYLSLELAAAFEPAVRAAIAITDSPSLKRSESPRGAKGRSLLRFDLDKRYIYFRVGTDDFGGILLHIVKDHGYILRPLDHMVIGYDKAFPVDGDTRSETSSLEFLRLLIAEKPLPELLEGVILAEGGVKPLDTASRLNNLGHTDIDDCGFKPLCQPYDGVVRQGNRAPRCRRVEGGPERNGMGNDRPKDYKKP